MNKQATEWEEIFAGHTSDNSSEYKEALQINKKKQLNIKKDKILEQAIHRNPDILITNKYKKDAKVH